EPSAQPSFQARELLPRSNRGGGGAGGRAEASSFDGSRERPRIDRKAAVELLTELANRRSSCNANALVGEKVGQLTCAGTCDPPRIARCVTASPPDELHGLDRCDQTDCEQREETHKTVTSPCRLRRGERSEARGSRTLAGSTRLRAAAAGRRVEDLATAHDPREQLRGSGRIEARRRVAVRRCELSAARRRIERQPTVTAEPNLHPGVCVVIGDRPAAVRVPAVD